MNKMKICFLVINFLMSVACYAAETLQVQELENVFRVSKKDPYIPLMDIPKFSIPGKLEDPYVVSYRDCFEQKRKFFPHVYLIDFPKHTKLSPVFVVGSNHNVSFSLFDPLLQCIMLNSSVFISETAGVVFNMKVENKTKILELEKKFIDSCSFHYQKELERHQRWYEYFGQNDAYRYFDKRQFELGYQNGWVDHLISQLDTDLKATSITEKERIIGGIKKFLEEEQLLFLNKIKCRDLSPSVLLLNIRDAVDKFDTNLMQKFGMDYFLKEYFEKFFPDRIYALETFGAQNLACFVESQQFLKKTEDLLSWDIAYLSVYLLELHRLKLVFDHEEILQEYISNSLKDPEVCFRRLGYLEGYLDERWGSKDSGLHERNIMWQEGLKSLLQLQKQGHTTLMVGCAHLYGSTGMIEYLQSLGGTVKRIRSKKDLLPNRFVKVDDLA